MDALSGRSDERAAPTAEHLKSVFRRHVLDVWFPRSLDFESGGFLCGFDRTWKPRGAQHKLLEFQARHTLLAAEAITVCPDDARLRQAAVHGFRYLREMMWDGDSGGWFHRLDRAGRPLESHTKHAHGAAYAIQACVAVHEATREPGALELARKGFAWLERCAHDQRHGGYFGFLKQDGTVIRHESECPWKATADTIGTPIGLKDANVHSDLLEALVYLYRAWPDPQVAERLAEVVEILCDKGHSPQGDHFFFQPDWTPVPDLVRFGIQLSTAYRLILARGLVGNEDRIRTVARTGVDHALRCGWDRHAGGFYYAGPGSATTPLEGRDLFVRRKSWWVQAEGLKALLTMSQLSPEKLIYRRYFEAQWKYVENHLLDFRHGGSYPIGLDVLPHWQRWFAGRFAPADFTRKGGIWKGASHDGRALLYCLTALRGGIESAELATAGGKADGQKD